MNIFYANSSPENWPACKENEIFGVKSGTSLPDIEPGDLILLRVGGKGYGVRAIWQFDSAEQVGPSTFVPWSDAEYGWILHCTPLVKEFTKPFSEAFATKRKLSTKISGLFATHLMGSIGMLSPDHGASYLSGILHELGAELQGEMDIDGSKVTVQQYLSDVVNNLSGRDQSEIAYPANHGGSGRPLGEAGEPRGIGRAGGDLLIVDNSDERWKVANYLREWCQLSDRFDIATGNFEIGGLLSLGEEWQKVDQIRILMGDRNVSLKTKQAFDEAVRRIEGELDSSLEQEKVDNPFLTGVPAIVQAIEKAQISCRLYRNERFHAKAYITHARAEVLGAFALVGSSNLSHPGLTSNIELNVQLSRASVAQLQAWYEQHWGEAVEVTPDLLRVIHRHTAEYSPFEVYAKALQEFFHGHELTATEWDESKSQMFHHLDRYQQEAYWSLMKIARQHGGAFLCDGVGLGKTFVGLMLIERLILHEGKRVALFAPKGAREAVWEPHIKKYLPHIGGVGGSADFSNLAVFNHTDLGRGGDYPARFRRISELADAVIIDEAHHFRNPGRRGGDGRDPSRYYQMFDLLEPSIRPKSVFLLTATPINNRLSDFRHMAELFTRRDEAYFARTLGVNNLRAHFNNLEKAFRDQVGHDSPDTAEYISEAHEILETDKLFRQLVVQRSRSYAKESQMRETGSAASFPERIGPIVAEYSIRKTYGRLLDMIEQSFKRQNPLFTLAIYYPLHWYKGDDKTIDPLEEGRQKQVVGLIRTQFLKRFESSVAAFELSSDRLMKKLLAFVQLNSESEAEKKRLERWKAQNAEVLGYVAHRQLELWGEDETDFDEDEDVVPQELLEQFGKFSREEFEVSEMIQETFMDLDQIVKFVEETRKFDPKHDDKLKKLIRLLTSKELAGQKVLIFTEFADTARYLAKQLRAAGIQGLAQVDSGSKRDRAKTIEDFSPYYNGISSSKLKAQHREEIRVLISTDVLSEGLNLQDASRIINYDIHWNPVRLMQRIGRVDRRLDPETEKRLKVDHPEIASSRGKVWFWNFLPPDELNEILSLYTRVTQKTLLISKTLGIEGKKLLTAQDDFDALKQFNQAYEGVRTAVEDMLLEYQELIQADPTLEARLRGLPGAVFSGRERLSKRARGVFFSYALPALDKDEDAFTEEAGSTQWYLYDLERDTIIQEPSEIVESIRSGPDTTRVHVMKQESLIEIRERIQKHIKNTYLKQTDAPIGVRPRLQCWMELNEG